MKEGGVIAYPTETFYGLGADIGNAQAIEKIYAIKGRDFDKPVSIIIGSRKDLAMFARDITPAAETLMDRFWPGGITLLFNASQDVPGKLTAKTGKIGIRLSSNPIANSPRTEPLRRQSPPPALIVPARKNVSRLKR